ncbi:MAG: pantoate--beta-alanine ligase [Planctomycetia bacterium]|nr:pantoate--beta-alanine ligase [Planctomycetia bacterium]
MTNPEVIHDPSELARRVSELKSQGKTIGLVPTMGALHYGHLSLAIAAKNDCDVAIVSVFVNPTQFAPNEDYDQYPRQLQADIDLLSQVDTDIVFAPSPEAMYPRGFVSNVHVGGVTTRLEGSFRPTHFDGVATVVMKLFQLSQANVAFFGQKDFQQVAVIRRMVADLNVPTEIIACPIVREADGLALSSRNKYLSAEERKTALVLSRSLGYAKELIHKGEREAAVVKAAVEKMILDEGGTAIDYVSISDPDSLQEMTRIAGNVVVLLAVRVGKTRLIDNMVIEPA